MSTAITIRGASIVNGIQTPQTAKYREWVLGDTASTTTAAEYIETWCISRDNVFALRPAPGAAATTPYTACKFREMRVSPDGFDATVEIVYRSPEAANTDSGSGGGNLTTSSLFKQLDVGVVAQPIPLHPYFSATSPLTAVDLWNVNELLTNASSVTDNGTTLAFMHAVHDADGNLTSITVNLTGKPRELALYRLNGVESYYIPAPIFRLTRGQTNADFTNFGAVGQRDHPGYSLPGDATNWLKTAYRADDAGAVERTDEEWTYNKDGWDTFLNHLYS